MFDKSRVRLSLGVDRREYKSTGYAVADFSQLLMLDRAGTL